jgi:hypothetical protein
MPSEHAGGKCRLSFVNTDARQLLRRDDIDRGKLGLHRPH